MKPQHRGHYFPYRYGQMLAPMWLPFWRPSNQSVTLTDNGQFVVRYGPFRVETPPSGIRDVHVTAPYRIVDQPWAPIVVHR